MTIAVSGNFTEGVVLGADSAVSYTARGTNSISHLYNGAQKVYHLGLDEHCNDSPYGAMVYGAASYAGKSWRNMFACFCRNESIRELDSADAVVNAFTLILERLIPEERKRPIGGVIIGGFGSKDSAVRCFRIPFPSLVKEELTQGVIGFDGVPDVVQRMLLGVDARLEQVIRKQFKHVQVEVTKTGGKKTMVPLSEVVLNVVAKNALKCTPDTDMPLRDAIDYVHFLVYSTIKHFKFSHQAPVCGGAVELVAITLDRGFRRVIRKPLDSQIW